MTDSADFRPTASIEMLKFRAAVLDHLRRFFRDAGYFEVETPILSRDIVVDAHLHPFVTQWEPAGVAGGDVFFLQTSPEFAMKRLLAAGADAIFQVARVMRNGEFGTRHNPEFTMVEWYRRGDTHVEQMAFTESLVRSVHRFAAGLREELGMHSVDGAGLLASDGLYERLTYDEACERFLGTRCLEKTAPELAELARALEIAVPNSMDRTDRDDWLNLLFAERIQSELGQEHPVFLTDYPATQAALARVRDGEPPVAERFELFVSGVELCNGYHELTDADELRKRQQRELSTRRQHGGRALPTENRLLDAMDAGLPDCAGVALGFDRLLMLLSGTQRLADVMAFPFDRA